MESARIRRPAPACGRRSERVPENLLSNRKPFPVIDGPFNNRHAKVSPNGRWIAHNPDETGQLEIYVPSFPPGSGKWQESTGGCCAFGRADGRELLYIDFRKPWGTLMAVPVKK